MGERKRTGSCGDGSGLSGTQGGLSLASVHSNRYNNTTVKNGWIDFTVRTA